MDRAQLRQLTQPTLLPNGERIPGLKLDHPRQLALMHALLRLSHIAAGNTFTTAELHPQTAQALWAAPPLTTASPLSATPENNGILIAEDDRMVQKALPRLVEREGFNVDVTSDGKSAMEAFHAAIPAAVVLDLGLPVMSGQEVCREIRRESLRIPVIILSALSDVRHKVLLLEMGANSYVTMPFSPRELLARVRALIRQATKASHSARETFDGVSVDFEKMEVTLDGHPVSLTPLEFKTLRFFLQNTDRVVSRGELLKNAFGYHDDPPLSHNLDVHVYCLRRKLEREPANPMHFCTIKGEGYRFMR